LIIPSLSVSLFGAAIRGDLNVLRRLLLSPDNNINVNAIDKKTGLTAVFFAAQLGHVDVVATLHTLGGARLDIPATIDGRTPAYAAAANGYIQVVKLIADANASINVMQPRKDGRTPLHAAAMGNHVSVINTLIIDYGAKVNVRTNIGGTPLYIASHFGHLKAVVRLFELGGNVNVAKYDGTTPVFVCAQQGHIEVLRKLHDLGGADVDVADSEGYTPLFVAAQHKQIKIATLLVHYGADLTKALSVTREKQHPEAFRILKTLKTLKIRNTTKENKDESEHAEL